MDVIRSVTRQNHIGYHLTEAEAWLAASERGARSTLLSYAAFELRLEIERIALELLVRIRGDAILPEDVATIRSFGKIENRIYELEGHQRILDRKLAFFNTMLDALQVEWRVQPIPLGRLRAWWHSCSELCHITWSLLADSKEAARFTEEAFNELSQIQQQVQSMVTTGISWPRIADSAFAELQVQYVREEVGDEEVRAWLTARGLWARKTLPDGSAEFVGVAIAPAAGQ